jgi:hypothetical protein
MEPVPSSAKIRRTTRPLLSSSRIAPSSSPFRTGWLGHVRLAAERGHDGIEHAALALGVLAEDRDEAGALAGRDLDGLEALVILGLEAGDDGHSWRSLSSSVCPRTKWRPWPLGQ